MSKNRIVFIIGLLVLVIPYLGFPSSWERVFLFLAGAALIILSFSVSASKRLSSQPARRSRKEKVSAVFVDAYTPLDDTSGDAGASSDNTAMADDTASQS